LGRWPSAGMAPASHSRDVIGPLGRTVADIALLDSVVSGEPVANATQLKGTRLGVPRSHFWEGLDGELETVVQRILEILHASGVVLVDVDIREIAELDQQHGLPIALFETLLDVPSYLIAGDSGVSYDSLVQQIISPAVKRVISQAPSISLDTYKNALEARARMQGLYRACWERNMIDALIFPTTVLPARPIGQDETVELQGRQVPTFPTYIRNTGPASVAGIPGLSLPAGLTRSGLPVGIELDGPAWTDRRLLGLGLALEKLLPALPIPGLPNRVPEP
jgi:Asp-tRNA(Asn)/Glu-tRNA(Gln) amidotransferase A subunit family amidase